MTPVAKPEWLEILRTFWPIVVVATGVFTTVAVFYLRAGFAARPEHDRLAGRVADHERRLTGLEQAAKESPTRQELQENISGLAERMAGVEAELKGVSKQMGTQNQLLGALIERGLQK